MADSEKITDPGIPVISRLFFYGMLGFSTEVMFTALWYVLDSKYNFGWALHGCTSVWAFPIYAISMYAIEKMFLSLHTKVPLAVRGLVYLSWTYIWEFTTGFLLRQFAVCPWDYHDYTTYHVMGLITFDYAPLWYIGTIILETIFIKRVLLLQYPKLKDY
jgi:uncharacterized membrane protein